MKRYSSLALALALTASATTPAFADDTANPPPPPAPAQVAHWEIQNGHRVWVMPTGIVHGERQTPYQFNVDGRRSPDYRAPEGAQHFTSGVVDAVRRNPF